MQGVLHDSEALDGSFLLLLGLVHAFNVIEIVPLLMQIDRPILKVCVQFKHDQGQTEACCRKQTRDEQVHHQ